MKLQILSDIHIEHHMDGGRDFVKSMDPTGVDVLILAGDIGTFFRGQELYAFFGMVCKKYPKVLYILGNHEHYQYDPTRTARGVKELKKIFADQLTVLDSSFVYEFGGKRFFGDTMWYQDRPDNFMHEEFFPDFKWIKHCKPFVYDQNPVFRANADKLVQKGDIVITHHLPSDRSVCPSWKASQTNRFFVSAMDDLIADRQPALWIHGHTHTGCDYVADNTRIICNPFGYPGAHVGFRENLIVEV